MPENPEKTGQKEPQNARNGAKNDANARKNSRWWKPLRKEWSPEKGKKEWTWSWSSNPILGFSIERKVGFFAGGILIAGLIAGLAFPGGWIAFGAFLVVLPVCAVGASIVAGVGAEIVGLVRDTFKGRMNSDEKSTEIAIEKLEKQRGKNGKPPTKVDTSQPMEAPDKNPAPDATPPIDPPAPGSESMPSGQGRG